MTVKLRSIKIAKLTLTQKAKILLEGVRIAHAASVIRGDELMANEMRRTLKKAKEWKGRP